MTTSISVNGSARKWWRYPAYEDSGVEWLGSIPAHWKKEPLKYITRFVNGAPFKPRDWGDEGTPIIRIENLNGGQDFNYTKLAVEPRYCVRKDDLLFAWSGNRGTSFGPFLWNQEGEYFLNQHIFRLEAFKLQTKWLYWVFKGVTAYVESQAHGIIGLVHITKQDLGIIRVPVVPN
jgi:type I restriction enzyme S subunit